jgi:hypothetical protein
MNNNGKETLGMTAPDTTTLLLDALQVLARLERAASNRENHEGDPSSLFVARARLRESAEAARQVLRIARDHGLVP